mgnify:CR=1 FL=1
MDHLTMNANEISHLRDVWKKCMKNGGEPEQFTQSEFFQKYIPKDEVDFTEIFLKFNLGEIFKSDKIITKLLGKYNCNYLFRQVSEIPHLIIYSDENFVAFQPLGEPGRDVKNFKIGHLMVLNHNHSNRFSMNEMLPLCQEEKDDLRKRSDFMKMAYNSLFNNYSVKHCGQFVLEKARTFGFSDETPIREFFSFQIMNIPEEIKRGRPGYKLMVNDIDISNDRQKINSQINRVFNLPLKTYQCIQGPKNCSQLVSHIHGFLFESEKDTFDDKFYKHYISLDEIITLQN